MKYVSSLSDIPQAPHFVIVRMTSVHIPGDERSRTNPGHGYPEHFEHKDRKILKQKSNFNIQL